MNNDSFINSVNLNQETNFPYLVLDVVNDESHPGNPGFRVMHWHEDLQFIYVLYGSIKVRTLQETVVVEKGEGMFINKNVAHSVDRTGPCHYNSFIFPDRFLRFYAGSPADRMVKRIVECSEVPLYVIAEEGADALSCLQKLSQLETRKDELYPYEVLTTLCLLWLSLSRMITVSEGTASVDASEQRVEAFLQYIELHFSEEVSLEALAASANVSKSECLRCFKAVLHTTPYRYLMEYRLLRAAEKLRETDDPISVVSASVGFNYVSHFGKCFREKTGMSPSEYRKAHAFEKH